MTTGADVVAEARRWLGTPWVHQAALRGIATDCLGLVAGVGLALELPGADRWRGDTRMRGYSRAPNPKLMLQVCGEYLDPIARNDVQPGDILLMRFDEAPQHFAILSCARPPRIVHAYAGIGRVTENGLDAVWLARVVRAYRYRGLA